MSHCFSGHHLAGLFTVLCVAGCAVGPEYEPPVSPDVPQRLSAAPLTASATSASLPVSDAAPPVQWWTAFDDPLLDELEQRAASASPDLQTAALRFAQARIQRGIVSAQRQPQVALDAAAVRTRQSEWGASTRLFDAIGGGDRDALAGFLADPTTIYQAGVNASWEIDLWGRVARSIEAADADIDRATALLDGARLSIAAELARQYLALRDLQRQRDLTRTDIAAVEDRTNLLRAFVDAGAADALSLDRQEALLASLRAHLPALQAQESAAMNRIARLIGEAPGALDETLATAARQPAIDLPAYPLGLPSAILARRPDVRGAEAALHAATAGVGIAQAQLYPSLRIGASFGYESYDADHFGEWASHTWSAGPSLDLPIFDAGRRRATVTLRSLDAQRAAIEWHDTVRQAWGEVDDALTRFAAERAQRDHLDEAAARSADAYALAQARYDGGLIGFGDVLDALRADLQARREQVASDARLNQAYVALYVAIGGGDPASGAEDGPMPDAG